MRIQGWARVVLALLLVVAASLLFAGAAQAQTPEVIAPGTTLRFGWAAPALNPALAGADAATGYKLETFKETATGVTVTTVTVNDPTVVAADLPPALQPAGPFFVSVRAFNAAGDGPRASGALPFVQAAAPGAPATFRRLPVP